MRITIQRMVPMDYRASLGSYRLSEGRTKANHLTTPQRRNHATLWQKDWVRRFKRNSSIPLKKYAHISNHTCKLKMATMHTRLESSWLHWPLTGIAVMRTTQNRIALMSSMIVFSGKLLWRIGVSRWRRNATSNANKSSYGFVRVI